MCAGGSEATSPSGERRERHEVVANSVTFLGQRPAQAAEATEEVRAA
jgi:hypothetical protein